MPRPARSPAVRATASDAAGGDLALRRRDRQQQERGFAQGQAQRQRQPQRIVDGQQIGRPLPAGEPRREQAGQPARRREQEGGADGAGEVRHRQENGSSSRRVPRASRSPARGDDRHRRQQAPAAWRRGRCPGSAARRGEPGRLAQALPGLPTARAGSSVPARPQATGPRNSAMVSGGAARSRRLSGSAAVALGPAPLEQHHPGRVRLRQRLAQLIGPERCGTRRN